MFNFGNLLTSMMLATGVATTTPVNHAENTTKKATTQIADYYLNVDQTGTANGVIYNNKPTGSNILNEWDTNDQEYVINFQGNNNYLNVIATKYKTWRLSNSGQKVITYVQDINELEGVNNNTDTYENYNHYTTTELFVFQIDSYNYNIDNDIQIGIQFANNIGDYQWIDPNGNTLLVENLYFFKEIYTCYQNNWSEYLQRQNAEFGAYTVKSEIENVNNGYYYTKETRLITPTLTNGVYVDNTTINLIPNDKTYIVLIYTPFVKGKIVYENNDEADYIYSQFPLGLNSYTTYRPPETINAIGITGTNIIPDNTYEVIDIPGLMWEILTMPFAFVSQAFNLTLFPGTPYQLNISNLFLSIIAIVVFIWLITFFIKLKG